jgi:hypothetical protein
MNFTLGSDDLNQTLEMTLLFASPILTEASFAGSKFADGPLLAIVHPFIPPNSHVILPQQISINRAVPSKPR